MVPSVRHVRESTITILRCWNIKYLILNCDIKDRDIKDLILNCDIKTPDIRDRDIRDLNLNLNLLI